MSSDAPANPGKRIVYLDRRVAFIEPDRINVRPALAAALFPLFGLLVGIACFASIVLWLDSIPFPVVLILLVIAIFSIPLAGVGFVYAVAGANVVFDRKKQSGVWQQGFLGMGVGTTELVPFWKIAEIRIEETTRRRGHAEVEDLAQFEIQLVKVSGKVLKVGDVVVARPKVRAGLDKARSVADSIADMNGKSVVAPAVRRRRRVVTERLAQDAPDDVPNPDAGTRFGTQST
jgi:hypothetical protein